MPPAPPEPSVAPPPAMPVQYRALFDFEVDFGNGGGLQGQRFRLDIPGRDIGDAELAETIIADLRLLMVQAVRVFNKRIIAEAHKRACGTHQETCQ